MPCKFSKLHFVGFCCCLGSYISGLINFLWYSVAPKNTILPFSASKLLLGTATLARLPLLVYWSRSDFPRSWLGLVTHNHSGSATYPTQRWLNRGVFMDGNDLAPNLDEHEDLDGY